MSTLSQQLYHFFTCTPTPQHYDPTSDILQQDLCFCMDEDLLVQQSEIYKRYHDVKQRKIRETRSEINSKNRCLITNKTSFHKNNNHIDDINMDNSILNDSNTSLDSDTSMKTCITDNLEADSNKEYVGLLVECDEPYQQNELSHNCNNMESNFLPDLYNNMSINDNDSKKARDKYGRIVKKEEIIPYNTNSTICHHSTKIHNYTINSPPQPQHTLQNYQSRELQSPDSHDSHKTILQKGSRKSQYEYEDEFQEIYDKLEVKGKSEVKGKGGWRRSWSKSKRSNGLKWSNNNEMKGK